MLLPEFPTILVSPFPTTGVHFSVRVVLIPLFLRRHRESLSMSIVVVQGRTLLSPKRSRPVGRTTVFLSRLHLGGKICLLVTRCSPIPPRRPFFLSLVSARARPVRQPATLARTGKNARRFTRNGTSDFFCSPRTPPTPKHAVPVSRPPARDGRVLCVIVSATSHHAARVDSSSFPCGVRHWWRSIAALQRA